MTLIRVGTRDSALALRQTELVIQRLKQMCPDVDFELVPMKTIGDKILDVSLAKIGQKGLFTKELENALQEGTIDIAVHSLKDLPTELPDGCELITVTERIDSRDVLVARDGVLLDELPEGARVGTSSLRRKAQLLNYRPDLRFEDMRGNVPTRLAKLERDNLDAVVIASAGLERLGLEKAITQRIPESVCLPAVGQGALGIEGRAGDKETAAIAYRINHWPTELVATAERAFLRRLGGGCQIPIAALGSMDSTRLKLDGLVASPDGTRVVRGEISFALAGESGREGLKDRAESLGVNLAEELLSRGAKEILASIGINL
ncbi:MAG: hydroxymethylbilane synthase [Firmicutes bacterium]|nr:hydroxymethylbilane synthase [Bacillota bacterium]